MHQSMTDREALRVLAEMVDDYDNGECGFCGWRLPDNYPTDPCRFCGRSHSISTEMTKQRRAAYEHAKKVGRK